MLTQGWLHRAVHLAEVTHSRRYMTTISSGVPHVVQVNPQTGLLRLRRIVEGSVDEGLQVLVSRLSHGENEKKAAVRAAGKAGAALAPNAVSIYPVKFVVETENFKDIHLASVWCVEVDSKDGTAPHGDAASEVLWLDRDAAIAAAEDGTSSKSKLALGKAAQIAVIELAKLNETHFSCHGPSDAETVPVMNEAERK